MVIRDTECPETQNLIQLIFLDISFFSGAAYLEKDAIFISTHKFVGGVQTPGM